jgi:NADH-quinone oxidoreductase subunit L
MRVGIWGLAVPATILGLAFGPIEAVLDLPAVTAGTLAVLLGLLAAACGLGLGWLVPAPRLLGPVYPWARRGLSVGGGLTVWVGRPAMAVARGCERLEGRLYEAVLSLGRAGLFLASAGERAERGLFKIVLCVGRVSLRVATYVRFGDERRIDGLIFALVAAVRALGARARNLQSGLIHHSLAISAVAIAVTLAILLFASSTSF